tara:strand:+ start:162 stop:944 length:783 start_codon:yes stop_codon:yes gene_type:complete
MSDIKQAILFATDSRGIYIPQHFAESHMPQKWEGYNDEDITILLAGPDHEQYWEAWDSVLNDAETINGGTLHQDGDLWVVWTQLAINAVNECCADQLDYEESHKNAGNNYAHMANESWDEQKTLDLMKNLIGPDVQDLNKPYFDVLRHVPRWNVDAMGLEPDLIADLALDLFTMERGHMFGPYKDNVIVLDAYPLQEVEIELEHLDIDGITMDLIRESCDAYISGTDRAYMGTDAVWYAVVCPKALQDAIIDCANEGTTQ